LLVGHRPSGRDEADEVAAAQARRLDERRLGGARRRRAGRGEGEGRGREPAPCRVDRAPA
jgi:hypothetical protein